MLKPRTKSTAAIAAILSVLFAMLAGAAQAAPFRVGYGVSYAGDTHTVGTLDSRTGSGGHRTLCIESQWAAPASVGTPTSISDPRIAYLLNKYIDQTTSPARAAGLAIIVKDKYDLTPTFWSGIKNTFRTTQATNYASAMSQVTALNTEATNLAGPYTIAPDVVGNATTKTGTVNVGIKTGSGKYYPGVAITLTMTGPGVFTANNAKTITVTSTTALQSIPWKAVPGQSGAVKVTAVTAATLPPLSFLRYPKPTASTQTMVGASFTRISVRGADPIGFNVVWAPTTASQVTDAVISNEPVNGARVSDTVTISAGTPGAQVTVTGQLYGPLAALPAVSANPPAGTPLFDTATATATLNTSGAASVTVTSTKVPTEPGYYVWREIVSGGGMTTATSTYGRASESFLLLSPATVATQVSDQDSSVGQTISDSVTVTGIKTMPGTNLAYSISGSLLGPLEPVDGVCAGLDWTGAPVAATIPATAVPSSGQLSGLGSYTIPAGGAGCYTYTETLTAAEGGATLWTVDHAPGQASQTSLATIPAPGDMTIATQVNKQAVLLGAELTDSVTISGYDAAVAANDTTTASWTGQLLGPVDPIDGACANVDWTGAPVAAEFGPTEVTADGTVSGVGPHTVTELGCYTYTETLTQVWSDGVDTFSKDIVHAPGKVSQTTLVSLPDYPKATIATQVSAQQVFAGATISDTVTLTGVQTFDGQTNPDVVTTLSGSLLGPVAPVGDTCEGVDFTGAPVAATIADMVVTQDGDIAGLGEYTIPADGVGCYTYTETLTATQGTHTLWTVEHVPGLVSQTAYAAPLPTIATQVSQQIALPGATLTDKVTVDGLVFRPGVTYELSGSLLGPVAPVGGTCEKVNWTDAPVAVAIEPIMLAADTNLDAIGEHVVAQAGCYTYTETLTVTDGDQAPVVVTHKPGQASQTALVTNPAMRTETSSRVVTVGESITDTIWVTGMAGQSGTMTAMLYGPYAVEPGVTCADITEDDWNSAVADGLLKPVAAPEKIVVKGDGTYKTKPVKLAAVGCYTWGEILEVPALGLVGDKAIATPLGLIEETTFAKAASQGAGSNGGGAINSGDPAGHANPALLALGTIALAASLLLVASRRREQE